MRTVARRKTCDVIVRLKIHNHAISIHGVFMNFLKHLLNYKNATFDSKQIKIIHYSCEEGIKKNVARDHRLTTLGKPRLGKPRNANH